MNYHTLTIRGVTVECAYRLDGSYMPANATDPEERPSVRIVGVEVGGEDIMPLIAGYLIDDMERDIERELQLEGVS